MAPKISCIIPTFRRPQELKTCLAAVASARKRLSPDEVEVIVSNDDNPLLDKLDRDQVAGQHEIKWIYGPRRGPAANRNFAASKAQGNLLVFIDDDCIPDPALFESYMAFAAADPTIDVIEGRITADRKLRYSHECCPTNERGGYLWSANMAVYSKAYKKINGFDEDFPFPAMEDIDFRLRASKAGLKIAFCRDATVVHPVQVRTGKLRFSKAMYCYLLLCEKHREYDTLQKSPLLAAARLLKQHLVGRRWIQPVDAYETLFHELCTVFRTPFLTKNRETLQANRVQLMEQIKKANAQAYR